VRDVVGGDNGPRGTIVWLDMPVSEAGAVDK
jgi:hypothetical protein